MQGGSHTTHLDFYWFIIICTQYGCVVGGERMMHKFNAEKQKYAKSVEPYFTEPWLMPLANALELMPLAVATTCVMSLQLRPAPPR